MPAFKKFHFLQGADALSPTGRARGKIFAGRRLNSMPSLSPGEARISLRVGKVRVEHPCWFLEFAGSNYSMWDPQIPNFERRSGCCAMTREGTAILAHAGPLLESSNSGECHCTARSLDLDRVHFAAIHGRNHWACGWSQRAED